MKENDIVLGKFINYMSRALNSKRIDYYRSLSKISKNETTLDDVKEIYLDTKDNENELLNILNDKEKYLLTLHYTHGLSYTEISKITNEKVATLKQRRNRAIEKIKRKMGE